MIALSVDLPGYLLRDFMVIFSVRPVNPYFLFFQMVQKYVKEEQEIPFGKLRNLFIILMLILSKRIHAKKSQ